MGNLQVVTTTAGSEALHMVGFAVGKEEFCVDILKVQEIIRMVPITAMPNAPDYVEGVINLRGKVIPVIDFRKRFHIFEENGVGCQAKRIVVVSIGSAIIGLVVDKVSQVLKMTTEQITPTPAVVKGYDAEAITGVGRIGDKLLIVLALEKIFSEGELAGMAAAA